MTTAPQKITQGSHATKDQMDKSRVFAEVITYMENSAKEGIHLFKLSQLHEMYELQDFDLDISVNKTG